MKGLQEQLMDMLKNNTEEINLVDTFHDLRRDMLIELEELFDKVDDGYDVNEYKAEVLEVAIREMQYVLGLLKIIRTNL